MLWVISVVTSVVADTFFLVVVVVSGADGGRLRIGADCDLCGITTQ